MRSSLRATAVAALLAVAGCGETTAPSTAAASFTATTTGALVSTLSGESLAYSEGLAQRPHQIYMSDVTDPAEVKFVSLSFGGFNGPAIRRGTFPVAAPSVLRPSDDATAFYASLYLSRVGANGTYFSATSGTVTIESVSSRRVRGRLDLELHAVTTPLSTTSPVHLTGQFDAPVRVIPVCVNCVIDDRGR